MSPLRTPPERTMSTQPSPSTDPPRATATMRLTLPSLSEVAPSSKQHASIKLLSSNSAAMSRHLLQIYAAAIPPTGPTSSRISHQTRSTISLETADFATTSTSVTSPRTRSSSRAANPARLSASSPISAAEIGVKHSLHPNATWTKSIATSSTETPSASSAFVSPFF